MRFESAALGGLMFAGLAFGQATSPSTDVWLASKAKVVLLTTEGLSVKDVDVAALEGIVTLHGKVRTGAEKAKAGQMVSAVEGVKSVINLMSVAPQAFGATGKIEDDVLRRSVDAALRADPRFAGVKVVSVENGVVVLSGAAPTLEEKLRAIEAAWGLPGVSRVTSRIEVAK